jgi:ATP-binding cassette subfamily G (WHITE) protein 2 (SNQ2)
MAVETAVTLFKRGSKRKPVGSSPADASSVHDPEKGPTPDGGSGAATPAGTLTPGGQNALSRAVSAVDNVFTWRNVTYTVSTKDGDRRLLDNISGYVPPGKLTALMGESGAGTYFSALTRAFTDGALQARRRCSMCSLSAPM